MKLLVLSDLHNEFRRIEGKDYPQFVVSAADVVVLAGDIDTGDGGLRWARTIWPQQPIVYVAGNHEHYGRVYSRNLTQLRAKAMSLGIHFLENDGVVLDDVRFLGCTLWTDFLIQGDRAAAMDQCGLGMNDYHRIFAASGGAMEHPSVTRPITPQHTLRWHERSRNWLVAELEAQGPWRTTVVVTHHLPHPNSVLPKFRDHRLTGAYCSDLTALMGGAPLWIHGHAHDSLDYEVHGTRVVCNPLGYWPDALNAAFEPLKLIEV